MLSTTCILLAASAPVALAAGKTERASVSSAEAQADNGSFAPSLGGGGKHVAFQSAAANLASVDPASLGPLGFFCCNVFVRAREKGKTQLVSTSSAEVPANGRSFSPFISRNGLSIVFASLASNLVTGDANGVSDVFVRNHKRGTTELVSTGDSGQQGDSFSFATAISASGRYVAFNSAASNLVPSTGAGFFNLFVRDRERQTTTVETIAFNGGFGNAPFDLGNSNTYLKNADLSADGRFVAFDSLASNLVQGDSNDKADIFLRDRKKKRTTLVTVAADGGPANGDSALAGLSNDGRYVAFCSDAPNLVPGDTNGQTDAFVRDLVKRKTTHVSLAAGGGQLDAFSCALDITPDGRYVLLVSYAAGLVEDTAVTPGAAYRYDRKTKKTILVSVSNTGEPADNLTDATNGGLSSDGRTAAFASLATNLVPDDTNGTLDVFYRVIGQGDGNANVVRAAVSAATPAVQRKPRPDLRRTLSEKLPGSLY